MKVHSLLKAAVLGLALSGPASAAVYTGIWDPQFGAPFADSLGWSGKAVFNVPDSCEPVLPVTVDVNNVPNCGGGVATLTSATVVLYDIGDPLIPLATIDFSLASITIETLHYVLGNLDSFDTSLTSAVALGPDLTSYKVPLGTTFSLSFTADGPRLYFNCPNSIPADCGDRVNNNADFPAIFNLTRVPEPASLALSGLAMAGLLATRRRRLQQAV